MKMNKLLSLLICITALSVIGCNSAETLSKDELIAKTKASKTLDTTIWYYKGSSDRYDFFQREDQGIQLAYRVNYGEVTLNQRFPLTEVKGKWVMMPWGPSQGRIQ